jgi:hypothetical protein
MPELDFIDEWCKQNGCDASHPALPQLEAKLTGASDPVAKAQAGVDLSERVSICPNGSYYVTDSLNFRNCVTPTSMERPLWIRRYWESMRFVSVGNVERLTERIRICEIEPRREEMLEALRQWVERRDEAFAKLDAMDAYVEAAKYVPVMPVGTAPNGIEKKIKAITG